MGQINLDCLFGKWLKKLASTDGINTICEVGSWNGQGSTRCIVEGMKQNSELYSIEANKEFHNKARSYWADKPHHGVLNLIHGSLHRKIMSREEICSHRYYPKVATHYKMYYDSDLKDLDACIVASVPTSLDTIVLDGGEFSSYEDWKILQKTNPKIVCLDDTLVIKNDRLLSELKQLNWITVAEGSDRHGWAILMNLKNTIYLQ